MAAAAAVRRRIRDEAMEEGADPDLFDETEKHRRYEELLPLVEWSEPPATVGAAVDAYRQVASRKPSVLLAGTMWGALALLVVGGIGGWILGPLGLFGGLLAFAGAFSIGRLMAASRYHWGTVSVSHLGWAAFVTEYARSRGLRLEDRWRFHSEFRGLPLPGSADYVIVRPPGRDRRRCPLRDACRRRRDALTRDRDRLHRRAADGCQRPRRRSRAGAIEGGAARGRGA